MSRQVLFWARKDRPSFTMRGRQIGERLAARGYEVAYRTGWEPYALRGIRDSVVVAVKARPHFVNLVRHGNRVLWDAIDYEPSSYAGQVHAAIAGSEDMAGRLREQLGDAIEVTTVYHHADPGIEPKRVDEETLRLVYVGEPKNSAFLRGEIDALHKIDFRQQGWRDRLRDFNAHFSARNDRSKAVVKLSNVAALGAVFLTGREPGCVELLGEDYPFYIEAPDDLAAVTADVARLQAAVGGPEWRDARDRIDALRDRLTLDATVDAYAKLIDSM